MSAKYKVMRTFIYQLLDICICIFSAYNFYSHKVPVLLFCAFLYVAHLYLNALYA